MCMVLLFFYFHLLQQPVHPLVPLFLVPVVACHLIYAESFWCLYYVVCAIAACRWYHLVVVAEGIPSRAGFHSLAVAWRFSNEEFIKKFTEGWLSNGKLCIGWGQTGNSNIGGYKWGSAMPVDGRSWYTKLSTSEYVELFHEFAETLKDANVTNVVLGYSTDGDLERCPVDDICAVELRRFVADADSAQFDVQVAQTLPKVVTYAQEHMMAVGLTTGLTGCTNKSFFTTHMLPIVQRTRLTYLMFGRNYGEPHGNTFCVPYPGLDNELISDFVMMYNDKSTVFIRHLNGLYLKKGENSK